MFFQNEHNVFTQVSTLMENSLKNAVQFKYSEVTLDSTLIF